MKRMILLALGALLVLSAGAQEQTTPPAPGTPREVRLPQPVEKTLPNGMRMIVVPRHETPLVAARLLVRSGGAADPAGREGLAAMTATVLTKGTSKRSAEAVARGVEALGATLESSAGWDSSNLDLSVMSSNLYAAMEFFADVARNPSFAKSELDRERQIAQDDLEVAVSQPRSLGAIAMSRLLFGAGAYGHNLSGTSASLDAITRTDLVRFHRNHYRPANAVLVIAGDIEPDRAFELGQRLFGTWRGGSADAVSPRRTEAPAARVLVVDSPNAGQAAVLVGRTGIRRSDPAYMRAIVTNSVLGGGYSSRLNQEIRIRRGLSYGAGSSIDARAAAGPFIARTETKNESAAEVVGLMLEEMRRLSAEEISGSELTARKAALIGAFGQSLETTSGIVNRVSSLALYGLPLSQINSYVSGVESVTAEEVRSFARERLAPEGVHVVVVGDAQAFVEPLRERFENVEVIPASAIDLASATLRTRKTKS